MDDSKAFVDHVYDHIAKLGGVDGLNNATPAERTLAFAVDANLVGYVVQIDSFEPPSEAMLAISSGIGVAFQTQVAEQMVNEDIEWPFSVDELKKRLGYESLRDMGDDEEEDAAEEDEDTKSSETTDARD